jgi:hypothetical protein
LRLNPCPLLLQIILKTYNSWPANDSGVKIFTTEDTEFTEKKFIVSYNNDFFSVNSVNSVVKSWF